jgi:hypothetical protein
MRRLPLPSQVQGGNEFDAEGKLSKNETYGGRSPHLRRRRKEKQQPSVRKKTNKLKINKRRFQQTNKQKNWSRESASKITIISLFSMSALAREEKAIMKKVITLFRCFPPYRGHLNAFCFERRAPSITSPPASLGHSQGGSDFKPEALNRNADGSYDYGSCRSILMGAGSGKELWSSLGIRA